MFHSAFPSTKMSRHRNFRPLRGALVVVLCILLIYAYNSIFHRQYHQQNYANRNNNDHITIDNGDRQPRNIVKPAQRRVDDEFSTAATTTSTNTTVTIKTDNIIDAQRQAIASELKNFNFTEQMVGLSALTPETNGHPLQSVILSGWRSGSTFFGGILNAIPSNYHHHEPLSYYRVAQIRGPPESTEAISTLRQLLKCNYTGLEHYLEHAQKFQWKHRGNSRLWKKCHLYPQICNDPDFLNPFCRLFPFQSMKVIRLRANLSEQFLIDPSLNVKIVLLIRDPRGIIQSRKHVAFCRGHPDCDYPKRVCKDMVSDFRATEILTKKYPQRFRAIRYEDLSLNPFNVTKDILNFYGLPFHLNVKKFLDSHTQSKVGNQYSLFRNSKKAPFHWMRDLSFHEIDQIQKNCTEAMSLWGYKKADSENELRDTTFNPLLKFSFDITTAATVIATQDEQESDEN